MVVQVPDDSLLHLLLPKKYFYVAMQDIFHLADLLFVNAYSGKVSFFVRWGLESKFGNSLKLKLGDQLSYNLYWAHDERQLNKHLAKVAKNIYHLGTSSLVPSWGMGQLILDT